MEVTACHSFPGIPMTYVYTPGTVRLMPLSPLLSLHTTPLHFLFTVHRVPRIYHVFSIYPRSIISSTSTISTISTIGGINIPRIQACMHDPNKETNTIMTAPHNSTVHPLRRIHISRSTLLEPVLLPSKLSRTHKGYAPQPLSRPPPPA